MPNIRHNINIDTEEISGYTGLLGAVLHEAVKDLQRDYSNLIKELSIENYGKYKASRLFFERDCNGYCEEELSKYILEKAIKIVEEKYNEKEVRTVRNYIKLQEYGT